MEPYKARKMPFDYTPSNEISALLFEAREIYGEYKGYLRNMQFDYKCFLEAEYSLELYNSFKIDGAKIDKDNTYFMPYMVKNNISIEFENLKKSLSFALSKLQNGKIDIPFYNNINKMLFMDCKKDNKTKGSGHLRKKQNFLLKPGLAGSVVSFIPPVYTEVNELMKNMCEYINSKEDEVFLSTALTHYQYEKIHPYLSGNGKMGRFMIPVQVSFYKNEPPILFISESIDALKNTYFTLLSGEIEEDVEKFVKFFLQCIINQCTINIKRIKKINKVYKNDLEEFKIEIGGTTIYKIYPEMMKKIVFTTSDIVNDCGIHINSVNKVINKLVDKGFLIKQKKKDTNRVTFCYKNAYDVFMN